MKRRSSILKTLHHHLADATGKAVLLSGPWGCGKTYLWTHDIQPALAPGKPIRVSLFGVESLAAFKALLLGASLRRRGALIKDKQWDKASKGGLDLIGAALKKTFDRLVGDKIMSSTIDLLQLLDDGLVICVDDFERASPSIPLEELLGVVTTLAETRAARVLIIMNEAHLLERDPATGDILRRFKERVVMASVVADSDVASLYDTLVANHGDVTFRTSLSAWKGAIVSLFDRSNHANLRTLIRIVDALYVLTKALAPFVPTEVQVTCLSVLFIELQLGRLRTEEFYDFNDLALSGLARRDFKDLDEQTMTRIAFRASYLGPLGQNRYSFHGSLYRYVYNGYLDESGVTADLNPPSSALDASELLLNELVGYEWIFLSDAEVAALRRKGEDLLMGPEALATKQIIPLLVHARAMTDRAHLEWPVTVENAIRQRLADNARAGDTTFSHLERMRFSPQESVWKPYLEDYDEVVEAQERATREAQVGRLIDDLNVSELITIVDRHPDMLKTVVSEPSLSRVLSSWKISRKFHYFICGNIIDELNAYNQSIIPDVGAVRLAFRARLKDLLADPTLDNSMKWQIEGLLVKCASWE